MSFRALQRHVVAIWLALMLLAGLIAARADYVADLSAFLPTTPTAEQRVLLEQIKHGVTTRVMLIGIKGGDPAARAEASRELAAALRAGGEFDSVNNGDREAWKAAGEFIFSHRYLLSPAVDAQRFTVEGLRAAIADTVSLLGTPAGSLVKPLIWRDPTGEAMRIGEAMMPTLAPRVEEGVWVSRSAPRAVLVATTHADGSDLDAQARAIDRVEQSFAPLAARGLQLEALGGRGAERAVSRLHRVRGAPPRHDRHRGPRCAAGARLRRVARSGRCAAAGGQRRAGRHRGRGAVFRPGPRRDARLRNHPDRRGRGLFDLLPGAGAPGPSPLVVAELAHRAAGAVDFAGRLHGAGLLRLRRAWRSWACIRSRGWSPRP